MTESWDDIADWWASDIDGDLSYRLDVHPMLTALLPAERGLTLDLGCGEGQGMREVGGTVVGADFSHDLLTRAHGAAGGGPAGVFRLRAPDLSAIRPESIDTLYAVYLLDILEDEASFFAETSRVVAEGGALVVVINHPVYTATGSAPLMDEDGEVLWRWGRYFSPGSTDEPAGDGTVTFRHRPLGQLLTVASAAGWSLDAFDERPLSPGVVAAHPGYAGQEQIPRFAGFRWRKRGSA